jgi:hypothetical protein
MLVHDLRTLEGLLEQKEAAHGSTVEELEMPNLRKKKIPKAL